MRLIIYILLLFSCTVCVGEVKESIKGVKLEKELELNAGFKKVNMRKRLNLKNNYSGMEYFITAYILFFILIIIYITIIFLKIKRLQKEIKQIKLIVEKVND